MDHSSKIWHEATRLIQLGYRVFPCKPGAKTPATAHGCLDACMDADQIDEWFADGKYNLAVSTDGLIVVDPDTLPDGSANPWLTPERALELGIGAATATPRGGRHFWFRQPEGVDVRSSASIVAENVDIRSNGGYVLVPPSILPNGEYKYLPGLELDCSPDKLPTPPAWLMESIHGTPKTIENRQEHEPADDRATALAALAVLDPDVGYTAWLNVLMGLHSVDSSPSMMAEAIRWSQESRKFVEGEVEDKWNGFTPGGGITVATLCMMADEIRQKWRPPKKRRKANTKKRAAERGTEVAQEHAEAGEDRWTSIKADEGRTDAAFARRFLKSYGDVVLYVPEWELWLSWDSTRWVIDVGGCAITRLAQAVSDAIWHEVSKYHTKDAVDFAAKLSNPARWKSALKAAAAMRTVSVTELDSNPMLLNCPNGTLDLRTGTIRPHDRADRLTKLCPTPFDPAATCPLWEKSVQEIFAGSASLVAYSQRMCGWWLTGQIQEHLLHIAYGIGANGKSTFFNTLLHVLGSHYGMTAPENLLMEKKGESHPTEKADLFGMRLVIASESENNANLAESLVKTLTGGDRIRARRMRENFWEFDPTHKLVLFTNHKPKIKGQDHGIWRRLRMLPFTQVFDGTKADKTLPDKLKSEAAGILVWCVRGCLSWQKEGLLPPSEVLAATREYRTSQDVFGKCTLELCETGSDNFIVKFSDLWISVETWCKESGENLPGRKDFAQWLEDQGYKRFRSNGIKYRGIGLKA